MDNGAQADPAPRRPRPHVLFLPFPTQGHINPLLDVAHRLTASGILSTFLLTPTHYQNHTRQSAPHASSPLLRFAPLDRLPPHIDAAISSSYGSSNRFLMANTQLQSPVRTFILSHLLNHNDTIHKSSSHDSNDILPPISCLISDSFLPWTVELAMELRISRVEMWSASATAYLFGTSAPELISKGLLPFKQGTQDVPLDFLPGISTSRLGHFPLSFLNFDSLSHPMLQIALTMFEAGLKSERVLVNTFQELEAGAIEALKAKNVTMTPIGPTLLAREEISSTTPVEETQVECLRWLDKQQPKSVVYVAFGSTGYLSEEEIGELAAALEAVGRPFLWAIREGSATQSLPDSFRSGCLSEEKGLIVSWAPQTQVLGHESVGVFVSHCGWNSTLESLWSGVPIVGCPRLAEQNMNLWLLQQWGVAVAGVDTIMGGIGSVRRSTLTKALQDVMAGGDAGVRKNVAEMAAAAHAAVSPPSGSSSKAFQDFVDDLMSKC